MPKLKNTQFVTDRLICPIMHPKITKTQEEYICSALIDTVEKNLIT